MEVELVRNSDARDMGVRGERAWLCDRCNIRVTSDRGKDRWVLRNHLGFPRDICPHCADEQLPRFSVAFVKFQFDECRSRLLEVRHGMFRQGFVCSRLVWQVGLGISHRLKALSPSEQESIGIDFRSHPHQIMGIDAVESRYIPENSITLELRP